MLQETKNGVGIYFDNNILIGGNRNKKSIFIFNGEDLKEVNVNGFCMISKDRISKITKHKDGSFSIKFKPDNGLDLKKIPQD